MAEWTHRICERCWFDGQPTHPTTSVLIYGTSQKPILGVLEDGSYRRPVQVIKDVEPGACCYCGGMTITGIYVREDENELECRGRHDDQASWSRVGAE